MVRPLVKALLVEQAVAGVDLSPEEKQQVLAQALQRQGVSDASAMARHCAVRGCGADDLQRQLLLPLLRARPIAGIAGQVPLFIGIVDSINEHVGFTRTIESDLPLAGQRHDLAVQF